MGSSPSTPASVSRPKSKPTTPITITPASLLQNLPDAPLSNFNLITVHNNESARLHWKPFDRLLNIAISNLNGALEEVDLALPRNILTSAVIDTSIHLQVGSDLQSIETHVPQLSEESGETYLKLYTLMDCQKSRKKAYDRHRTFSSCNSIGHLSNIYMQLIDREDVLIKYTANGISLTNTLSPNERAKMIRILLGLCIYYKKEFTANALCRIIHSMTYQAPVTTIQSESTVSLASR